MTMDMLFETALEAQGFAKGVMYVNDSYCTARVDPDNPRNVIIKDLDIEEDTGE